MPMRRRAVPLIEPPFRSSPLLPLSAMLTLGSTVAMIAAPFFGVPSAASAAALMVLASLCVCGESRAIFAGNNDARAFFGASFAVFFMGLTWIILLTILWPGYVSGLADLPG